MKSISTRRAAAAIIAAAYIAIPASASATPYSLPATSKSDSAQSGGTGKTSSSIQPQTGSRVQPQTANKTESTFPPADFSGGDAPVDHPGASRAQPAPTTVEVVRPERTIVRDVDEALPIALSATALLLVLAMFGITLARTRLVPRPGRSH